MSEQIISWDDVLEDIPQEEYTVLEPGEYTFEVTSMERKQWDRGKLAPAKYAEIRLRFADGDVRGSGKENLTLHPRTLWRVREFFKSIGEKVEDGKPFAPNWANVIGATGRCTVKNGSFTGRDGEVKKTNEVGKFLPPTEEVGSNGEEALPF